MTAIAVSERECVKQGRDITENDGTNLTIQKKLQLVETFLPLKQLFTLNKL